MLSTLLSVVRRVERGLGPDDDWVEDDRRILFEWAEKRFGNYHKFTRRKGPADYVCTVDVSSDVVEDTLYSAGYQRNLLSTRKYRTHHGGGKQWAVGSWVLDPRETSWQQHVYLFEGLSGGTDIYSHEEPSVRYPNKHLDPTTGRHGDPENRIRSLRFSPDKSQDSGGSRDEPTSPLSENKIGYCKLDISDN